MDANPEYPPLVITDFILDSIFGISFIRFQRKVILFLFENIFLENISFDNYMNILYIEFTLLWSATRISCLISNGCLLLLPFKLVLHYNICWFSIFALLMHCLCSAFSSSSSDLSDFLSLFSAQKLWIIH